MNTHRLLLCGVAAALLAATVATRFLKRTVPRGVARRTQSAVTAEIEARQMGDSHATPQHANRLVNETSPYLLQHAHNPVDWYPWGTEAFERARQQDQPIFLSIGYSTCHWCHVMERESFEDEETAEILNEHFVAIKVDREQRPDVDDTYMKAVQVMTGSGGWPLSVFLTPDGKPFYGGTYFPPTGRYGRPGFKQVLLAIAEAWTQRRGDLLESSEKIAELLRRPVDGAVEQPLSPEILKKAFETLSSHFDESHAGFGAAPKFPQPTTLIALLHYWHRTHEPRALEMVDKTLDAMARGGIHDHLAGGFHRYSTDARWLVPHFEKMLYDQALLGKVYVQAYQITGKAAYATVARGLFDYVLRDMTDAAGGFYAAEDADSEGREGAFYVWKQAEIEKLLGSEKSEVFCRYYGVTRKGNFEQDENVLHVLTPLAEFARQLGRPEAETKAALAESRRHLLEHRNTRPRPHQDDKIITAWNGLMISSMAYGGAVLGEPEYVEAAGRAADFVLSSLRTDGRLRRYFRGGQAVGEGFLDDYAFLILGLMDLYGASFDATYLREAKGLAGQMIELFADDAYGGFFMTGDDAERLLTRDRPAYDGAVPSGNSMAALALLELGRVSMDEQLGQRGANVLQAFSGQMAEYPTNHTAMLLALDYWAGPTQEIVIAAGDDAQQTQALVRETRRHFLPNATLLVRRSGRQAQALTAVAPFVEGLVPVGGQATAYVCENYTCRQPVTTTQALRQILTEISAGN